MRTRCYPRRAFHGSEGIKRCPYRRARGDCAEVCSTLVNEDRAASADYVARRSVRAALARTPQQAIAVRARPVTTPTALAGPAIEATGA